MNKLTKAQEKRFNKKFKLKKLTISKGHLSATHESICADPRDIKSHLANELDLSTERGYWEGREDEKKEIVEKLEKLKELKPAGQIPVTNIRTFDFDSYKDGIDQAIKKINEIPNL